MFFETPLRGSLIAGQVTVEDASSELAIVEAATAALTIDCKDPIEDLMIDEGLEEEDPFLLQDGENDVREVPQYVDLTTS